MSGLCFNSPLALDTSDVLKLYSACCNLHQAFRHKTATLVTRKYSHGDVIDTTLLQALAGMVVLQLSDPAHWVRMVPIAEEPCFSECSDLLALLL